MIKWKEQHTFSYNDILKKPLIQQIPFVKQMFLKSKEGIKKMLKNSDQDYLIDIAYERAFHMYLDYIQS